MPESTEGDRVRRAFDDYAQSRRKQQSWSTRNRGNLAIRAEVLGHVEREVGPLLRRGGTVLDVGCGTGWLLEALSAHARVASQLHGVDILESRVAAARLRVPGAEIVVGDARSLPWPAGFDAVTLLLTLSSLDGREAQRAAVNEAVRVLAPDGLVLVWEPRWPNPLNPRTRRVPRTMLEPPGHIVRRRSLTVMPQVARRLGPATERLYPQLARLPLLRSHSLTVIRPTP